MYVNLLILFGIWRCLISGVIVPVREKVDKVDFNC
jgi:hypothetical protein